MPSMNHFDRVRINKPGSNMFDLSHTRALSCNAGKIIPVCCQEVMPGDRWNGSTEQFVRFAPMLAPLMHVVKVKIEHFYVPYRILVSDQNAWESFITGGPDGTDVQLPPYIDVNTTTAAGTTSDGLGYFANGSLSDHLGIREIGAVTVTDPIRISALPYLAYLKIYNEYYRDQNLEDPIQVSANMGAQGAPDIDKLMELRERAWSKDMYTSALPNAQRGPAVTVPIEGTGTPDYSSESIYFPSGPVIPANEPVVVAGGVGGQAIGTNDVGFDAGRIENLDGVNIDSVSTTLEDLRVASTIQRFMELMSKVGSRLKEFLLGVFGVDAGDDRLQRPEYLAGGVLPVRIGEVLSTFQDETGNPQGTMAGHGFAVGSSNNFTYFAREHGIILSLMTIIPDAMYYQGIPRMFTRETRYDFAMPQFAHLGEQPVYRREVVYRPNGTAGENAETFGYQSRFVEYKYHPSTVHGNFRFGDLAFWTWARNLDESGEITLTNDFVKCRPGYDPFAVQDPTVDHFYVQIYNRRKVVRKLPYWNVPTLY